MKIRVIFLLALIPASGFVFAQSDTVRSVSYFNSFHAGGVFGKKGNGSGESFATIHGIRRGRLALGIGVGYDAHQEWRTLPVFGSVSYDLFLIRDNAFFIQANAGYARAWYPREDEDQFIYERKRGPCFHPLLGYRITGSKFNLYLTAGYKFQSINYIQTPKWEWWGGPLTKITVGRDIERISIQLGFGFR